MEIAIVPRFIINKFTKDCSVQIHLNILLSGIFILLVLFVFGHFIDFITHLPHFCLFQKILGIPCPGCGISTSLIAISDFEFGSSWHYNPIGLFFAIFLIFQIPLRIIALNFRKAESIIGLVSGYFSKIILLTLLFIWLCRI